jgi:hypothetical protein
MIWGPQVMGTTRHKHLTMITSVTVMFVTVELRHRDVAA